MIEGDFMQLPNLDTILAQTLLAIEASRNQIFEIVENARSETDRLRIELGEIQRSVLETITEVDRLDMLERSSRMRLMQVSKDFERYTEKEVKQAYDKASELQVELASLREREKQLKLRRNEVERSLKKLEQTVDKAEGLITQIGVIFDYLEGSMKSINAQIEVAMHRRQFAPKIIQTQEEERRRIAREIHDGPAQSMANIVLRAEVCEKILEIDRDGLKQELAELKEAVKKSLQDVRRIIFDLRPMGLDDLGITPAVTRYLETFRERYPALEVESEFTGQQQRFESVVEVALYRIVQEALQNVVKHARATHVKVLLANDGKRFSVRIIDDGHGFDVHKFMEAPKKDNYGLIGMKERMEILGGQLHINSQTGKGTEILAVIPIDL
jgi:two-component system sensor histidine kinase DegS